MLACNINPVVDQTKLALEIQNSQSEKYACIKYSNQIESEFNVLYIGANSKLVKIDNFAPISQTDIQKYVTETQNFSHPNILFTLRRNLPKPQSEDLKLTIDSIYTYPIVLNRKTTESSTSRKRDTVLAHPVIIENVSKNFLEITYENKVVIEIQAKNQQGKWENITHPYQRFCGTGLYPHPIFPGEIVVSSIPIFKGKFATKGRLKIYNYFSDEFPIAINEEIFMSPYQAAN